jgi:hypothetical protein
LVDQMFALIGPQFHRIAVQLRRSAAMDAREVARLGHFPNGYDWRSLKSMVLICGFIEPSDIGVP